MDSTEKIKYRSESFPAKETIKEEERRFWADTASELRASSYIDPALYPKYNVKRGLRNANGTGVNVGLTHIGDAEGYYVNDKGEKCPQPGKLYYRGIDMEEIVQNVVSSDRFGYEETSYLLLFGDLPTQQQLDDYRAILSRFRTLPPRFAHDMILAVPSANVMNQLARSVLALYSYDSQADDISIENVIRQCIGLIARMPVLVAYCYQAKHSYYDRDSLVMHNPDPNLSTAENILHLIRPSGEFTHAEAKALDLSMIIHADHGGGNNSTFTTHVVSSTGTDTYAAIASAICSLKGPKHGGANNQVCSMIQDLKDHVSDIADHAQVDNYLRQLLRGEVFDRQGLIYGLGHAIYTYSDPRATALKHMARSLAEEQHLTKDLALYEYIEQRGPELLHEIKGINKPVCANVDLYSGFVYGALNIPEELAAPLFAASRISGWCAHRLEELLDGKLIRPAFQNVQEMRSYLPPEKR